MIYNIVLNDALEAGRRSIQPYLAISEGEDKQFYEGAAEGLEIAARCESIEEVQKAVKAVQSQLVLLQNDGFNLPPEAYLMGALNQLGFVLKRLKDMQPTITRVQKMHNA